MNKKFLSAILFGALMVTSTGTFVSCKDYDDDIDDLKAQIDANKSDCASSIQALQNQAAALQTALTTAQATADAAKTAAAAAQSTGDKALAAAEAAKAAAATAKAEAIAEAIKEVEALKAWVEEGYATKEELAVAITAVDGKIEGIEAGLSELTNYVLGLEEQLGTLRSQALSSIVALQEDLDLQQATLDEYAELLKELGDADAELWAELVANRNDLQTAITNLNNLIGDNTAAIDELWAELVANKNDLSVAITNLNNLVGDNAGEINKLWEALENSKSELKAEITANYESIVSLNADLATLHTLIKTRLTSMLFAPKYYVDGIEAIPFRTLKYNPWINLATDQEGQKTTENVTLSDGSTEASYFVSPSSIDLTSIEGYNVLLSDASNLKSRAAADVTATFKSLEAGKLTVNLKKNTAEVFGGEGDEFKVMALQAVLTAEEGEENAVVTSDWARIYEGHYLPQIHAINEKIAEPHLWSYADAKAAKEGQLIIKEADYLTPINLNELVTVCLTDIESNATENLITLDAAKIAAYGMKFEFALVNEYLLKLNEQAEATDQQKFAAIEVNADGDYIMTSQAINGKKESKDAIGREPLVQVKLVDVVNDKVVDVNYFKVKWTPVTNSEDLGTLKPAEAFADEFACGGEYTFTVLTEDMNKFFYTELDMSKEEFHNTYKPDNYPNGFIVRNEKDEVLENAGSVMQITAKGSTTTYNIAWTYTQGDITKEEWAAKKVERTVYLTYVNVTNPAETIKFNMSFVLNITDMSLEAGYVQTNWSGDLTVGNADKLFQVNPALTSDVSYGNSRYETCRIITNMLKGYNVSGIEANELTIADIVSDNVASYAFVFDAERAAEMNEDWTVSEDGMTLLVDGEEAAKISVVDDRPYIKLYETDNYNVATEAAKTLVGKSVPVKLVGTHCSGYTTVLDSYLVNFIEPLAAKLNMTEGKLEDLLTDGASLDIRLAITVAEKFGLKRDVVYIGEDGKLHSNAELKAWYAVEPATWDLENATTNLSINGNNVVITDGFETKFSAFADKYKLEVEKNDSNNPVALKFYNNTQTHIQQAFKVRIPVYVATKWNSKLTAEPTYVEVEIVPGVTE